MVLETIIFRPARRNIAILCFMIFAAIVANVYYLSESNGIISYFSFALLVLAFFYFFIPILKNQKVEVYDDYLKLSSFGHSYDLKFSRDLYEIVIKDSQVLSYRFESEGRRFQISPYAYYESDEVNKILSGLLRRMEKDISIVER